MLLDIQTSLPSKSNCKSIANRILEIQTIQSDSNKYHFRCDVIAGGKKEQKKIDTTF